MDPMSPTVAMSTSQKAKKVSIPDDPPLLACITEVVETLNRPEGAVRLTREHVTNVREHLSELGDIGGEVDPHMLEAIVDILGKDVAACRRMKVDAFSLLTEVLLVTKESDVRARGLYILGESLHKERLGATRKDLFQGRLDLIGQGCLLKLYDRFTENSVPYNSRRWMGTLVLELIGESEDNQGIIALMSTSQRAKLGSCILNEASEILRAITGRIITVMLAADHPIKEFFPPGTADKLFEKYPGPAQSASQWDKTFQEYLDDIWDEFCADNESNGQLQFAQNIITEPSHASIRDISARHRSIYVELSDNVRVYSHSGKDDFDSAIDIPLTSIGGIATSLTAVDGAQQMKLVDVVLTILPSALCFVNSLHAPLSVLRLTVADQEIADRIVDGLSSTTLRIAEETIMERQVAASSPARADSQGSSRSKKSCGEEDLVLDGSYAVFHDAYVEGLVTHSKALATQDEQANLEQQVDDEEEATIASPEQECNLGGKRKAPKEAKDSVLLQKAKAPATTEHDTVLKHTVEVDVVRDVDTGEVLTSEVLKIGLDASKKSGLGGQSTVKPLSIVESSDQLAEDDISSSWDPPQKESAMIQDYPNHREALPPPETKHSLKSKAPIRAPNTGKQRLATNERTRKQDTSTSKSKTNNLLSSPEMVEALKKSQLVVPAKKPTNSIAKLQPANGVLGTHLDEGDIYDLSSSPPKAKKVVKGARKGKKPAPPAKSSRTSGGKIKDRKNPLTDDVEEQGNFPEPHRSLSRSKKEPLTNKVAQKVPLETATTTSRGKRTIASRSTKGKKNMKDLTDSDIEELVAEEASMGKEIGVIKSKEMEKEKGAKVDLGTQEPVEKTKATELANTVPEESHKITGASAVRKGHVIDQPIARQRTIDDEPNNFNTPCQQQAKSSSAHPSNIQDAFHDATVVAAVKGTDDLDKALPPTAEIRNPAATVEAKIGRRMAEIFRSLPVNIQSDSQKNIDRGRSPQRPSPEGVGSNLPLESEGRSPDVLVSSHNAKPLSIRSEKIEKAIDNDEFIVLSSPPKIIETEAVKNPSKIAELSSAQDPIVVPGPDEKYSKAPNLSRTSAEKHTMAAPLVDNPSKRLRAAKAAVLSPPPQVASAPLSKREAIKAKVHAPKQAAPVPQSSPVLASEKDHGSSIDHLTLVDDHQARKTPLIAFGPNGPRNQCFSSAVKATRITNNEDKTNTLSGISEKISKQSADQGPSPTKQSKKRNSKEARRQPRVPDFEASLAQFSTGPKVDRFEQDDSGMAFFDAERSTASCRSHSHSRVDINGSPQPKRPSLAPRDSLCRVANDLVFGSTTQGHRRRPQRQMIAIERRANDEVAFEDDTTLFDSGFFISSNRKVCPAGPQDDLDFESRYTPHHSTENGVYVRLANQNVIDAAPDIPDPFNNKLKRQDSDFARKLRVSVNQEDAREAQLSEPPAAKAQSSIRHFINTVPQPSRLRSLVDANTTLVDIENRAPRRSKKSHRHESSPESSDSGANTKDGRDERITPTPQKIWRDALKPHQQDVSDVLHHVVDGLLKQLFDKEPAVQAIANEYRANGAKIVEGLKTKMGAEVQALNVHATSIIEDLAKSLRQSRAALQASSNGGRELDEQYKAWRARQHALHNLPFMARESSRRRS